MKLSMTPQPKNGLPLALIALLTAVALIGVSFAGLADTAGAAGKKQKVVAITPFAANTMALLGEKPVAIGQTLGGDRRYAPVLNRVKRLPLSHPNGPNLEQLAKIDPDVVFSSSRWSKGTRAMKQLGIKVKYADPTGLKRMYADTKMIARTIGEKADGNRLVKTMKAQVGKSTRNITDRPRVMLILGVGRTPFTFLENSWGGQIMELAGGDLQTGGAENSGGFARISDEVVIAQQPEIIVAVPHGNEDEIPDVRDYIEDNEAWRSTPAVENNRIYISTDNSLLQAGTDAGKVITKIRKQYLQNWSN